MYINEKGSNDPNKVPLQRYVCNSHCTAHPPSVQVTVPSSHSPPHFLPSLSFNLVREICSYLGFTPSLATINEGQISTLDLSTLHWDTMSQSPPNLPWILCSADQLLTSVCVLLRGLFRSSNWYQARLHSD